MRMKKKKMKVMRRTNKSAGTKPQLAIILAIGLYFNFAQQSDLLRYQILVVLILYNCKDDTWQHVNQNVSSHAHH